MLRFMAIGLIGGLLAPPGAATRPVAPVDPQLALGIRQVNEGDFDAAVFTLDRVTRRLAAAPERKAELCQAYAYFGAAYLGLENQNAAKGKFREALKACPELRLTPDQFAPKVIQVFDTQVLAMTAAKKRHGARVWLLVGGAGAATAVGVAAATSGGTEPMPNRPPTASLDVSLTQTPIAGVTAVTLTASATDPDGDALTYAWDLGDGTSATGASVTHVYQNAGAFRPVVTVTDGRNPAVTVTAPTVTVKSLSARWQGWVGMASVTYEVTQQGTALHGTAVEGNNSQPAQMSGTLENPRTVRLNLEFYNPTNRGSDWFDGCQGTVDAAVGLITVNCPASRIWVSTPRTIELRRQ